jgi:hypothetical protein
MNILILKVKNRILNWTYGTSKLTQNLNSVFSSKQVRSFTREFLYFSDGVASTLSKSTPRYDRFILNRQPALEFEYIDGVPRIKIDALYKPSEEIREDSKPYESLVRVLVESGILHTGITSLIDIGCTSGHLLSNVHSKFPDIRLKGLEIFNFLKEAAPSNIREKIEVVDLRKSLASIDGKFDIAICTEVGEHIDPAWLDVFLDNLAHFTGKHLILSWSRTYPGPSAPPQHVSVLTIKQMCQVMESWGFVENKRYTHLVQRLSAEDKDFFPHWRESISVWEKLGQID